MASFACGMALNFHISFSVLMNKKAYIVSLNSSVEIFMMAIRENNCTGTFPHGSPVVLIE